MHKPYLTFTVLILLLSACSLNDPGFDFHCVDNPNVCELAESNNAYGWDIFQKLHNEDPENNLFISPFSISTAFGMLLNGAKTETREEILQVMHLNGWTEEDINNAFQAMLVILPALDNRVKLNLANSIWYRSGFEVLDEFLSSNEEHFNSEIREMDFSDPETKEIINNWIEDQTGGKIKDMISQISPATVMFLINAIYFYGEWLYEFDKDDTRTELFYPDNKPPINSQMMQLGEVHLPFYSGDKYQMIDLPYGDSIFSMTILLPKENHEVDDLIKELDFLTLQEQFELMESIEFSSVKIPKFKIEYKKTLVETLKELGMKKVFAPAEADLSGVDGKKDLFVSKVIHQSFIEVDEKGTEAAAATIIVIDNTSVGPNSFIANRSFVFLIRDNRSGSILFAGKLMKTEEE